MPTWFYHIKSPFLFFLMMCLFITGKKGGMLYAQAVHSLRFEAFTINNGLSQGYVSAVMQDTKGFMWFATADGLNKYDGYSFKVYRHDAENGATLGSDDISCVLEDSKKRLWVGTRHEGLDLFDREHHVFYHIRHSNKGNSLRSNNILTITEDHDGAFWIRTREGIDRMVIKSKWILDTTAVKRNVIDNASFQFDHINQDSSFGVSNMVSFPGNILVDHHGHILLATSYKISEIVLKNNKWQLEERYRFNNDNNDFIPDLLEDPTDHCIVLNYRKVIKFGGCHFKDPKVIYDYNPQNIRWTFDKRGNLWLADHDLITRINIKTGHVQKNITDDPSQSQALIASTMFGMDRSGVIWIATGGYGILKYDPEMELFHHVLPGTDNYQLLSNSKGQILTNNLKVLNVKDNRVEAVEDLVDSDQLKTQLPKLSILSFTQDSAEDIWMGINGGIIKYDVDNKQIHHYNIPFKDRVTLPFPIYADKHNSVWMGYNQYFIHYNASTNIFTRFNYTIPYKFYDYDFLQTIYEDGHLLWLGSISGLFCFDIKQNKMVRYYAYKQDDSNSISNNFIYSICSDPNKPEKYLWIGTKGGGLNRLDKATGKFTRYGTTAGLPNNVVYGILPDSMHNLWISTNNGLSKFNPLTGQFQNFDISDGLQSNEFNRYAYCSTKDGLLVFGGLNGINFFNPNEIKSLSPPKVELTGFRLFNKEVLPKASGSVLTKDIGSVDTIQLKYEDNVVTFQFAAMDYRKPGNIHYRYKMIGFDKDYINAGKVNEATYTNLDPGKYKFVVQARFGNSFWGKDQTTITLIIVPPWWRTWWFITAVIVFNLAFFYGLYRFRLYQLTKLGRLRDKIARDLHDEVGSSLSTIAIYSKIVHDQVSSTTFNNEPLLKKITDNASEIMENMNDIVWNIHPKNDVFENIISRMREHAYQLFEAKGYILHFDYDESIAKKRLVMNKRRDFYLIYKEALNNIAKYSDGKNVWIKLAIMGNTIHLLIKDDGKGFDMTVIKKTSNGLVNMQQRAANLKGKITIKSAPGKGTEIYLIF